MVTYQWASLYKGLKEIAEPVPSVLLWILLGIIVPGAIVGWFLSPLSHSY